MSTQQETFLKLIAENEDDQTTRLIYADWLDDHGMVDEAMRQRNWIAAKQELINLLDLDVPDEEEYEPTTPFRYFIQMLNDNNGRDWINFGNRETLMYEYQNNKETVWRLWSIITGKPCPIELPYGSCAC